MRQVIIITVRLNRATIEKYGPVNINIMLLQPKEYHNTCKIFVNKKMRN